jgi:hypothetical protein
MKHCIESGLISKRIIWLKALGADAFIFEQQV